MGEAGARGAVAIVCALEDELMHARPALGESREEWRDGRVYWHGVLEGQPVVLVCCGIGMVSAAAATEAVIIHQDPAAVINYGCTGAHRDDLLPGDIVIGANVVAYDRAKVEPDGREHYTGMRYLERGEERRVEMLPADSALVAAAGRAAHLHAGRHESWPPASGWPASVPHREPRVVTGTVASADRWNQAHERIRAVVAAHDSLCEDMEAAAIALVCAAHRVPFLTIKDISNNELLRASDFAHFNQETAGQLGRRAAVLALATLREWHK